MASHFKFYFYYMNSPKHTLVLGASDNPARYSYLAVNRLRNAGHPVKAIGTKHTLIADVPVETEKKQWMDIHTVTLYMSSEHQKEYYDYILALDPDRIIFNPGAENLELEKLAQDKGITTMNACTLVMLSTGQY
jgi:predicted CoA-binding protein